MDRSKIFKKFHPLCVEAYQPGRRDTFCVGNDSGFLVREGRRLIVAIAGSNEIADWVAPNGNLRIQTVPLAAGVQVHEGMFQAAKAIAHSIGSDILEFVNEEAHATVIFTGHSRGGAIAQILPLILNLPLTGYQIVTFGSPRIFCGDRIDSVVPQDAIHFQTWSDVVHRLPLTFYGVRYRHVGLLCRKRVTGSVTDQVGTQSGAVRELIRMTLVAVCGVAFGGRLAAVVSATAVKRMAAALKESHSLDGGYSVKKWWGTSR